MPTPYRPPSRGSTRPTAPSYSPSGRRNSRSGSPRRSGGSGFGKLLAILLVILLIGGIGAILSSIGNHLSRQEADPTIPSRHTLSTQPTHTDPPQTDPEPTQTRPAETQPPPTETQPPPTETQPLPTEDHTPGIPAELESHPMLLARDQGACRKLRGQVLLTILLVTDPESHWDDQSLAQVKQEINDTALALMEDARGYGVPLDVKLLYLEASAGELLNLNGSSDPAFQAIKSTGYDPETISQTLCRQYNVDAAPVLLYFNRPGRCFAKYSYSPDRWEYAAMFQKSPDFRHELFHVFGAQDYYLYKLYKTWGETYFPESVMLKGAGSVDPLTAYFIGWSEEPTAEGIDYLRQTIGLTQEEMDAEYAVNTYTGYVENYIMGSGIYTGNLMEGICHGYGTIHFNDGNVYTGYWKQNQFHGQGTFTWANGDSCFGNYVEGKLQGQGTFTWASGSTYSGEFVDGHLHGYGIMIWTSGSRYEGYWENGKQHGQGTMTWPSGQRQSGLWQNGEFVG